MSELLASEPIGGCDLLLGTAGAAPALLPGAPGLCACGCGGTTSIVRFSDRSRGRIGGHHSRFITGHNTRTDRVNRNWKGGRTLSKNGYAMVRIPEHPRANPAGYVMEHVVIVEAVLGHYLPVSAPVHHLNRDRTDNRNTNLVVCQDSAYHALLHRRQRALDECGHASWLRCVYCKRYDAPGNVHQPKKGQPFHRACRRAYDAERTAHRRGEA
jgi:hypothetical protein